MKFFLSLFSISLLFSNLSLAQSNVQKVLAKKIDQKVTLDGLLDEPFWNDLNDVGDFWQYFPSDSIKASSQTIVKIGYDEQHLYVGITAFVQDDDFVISSLKRDFSGISNDNVSLVFDTFRDGANAFLFGVTPYGVQRDVLVSEGGSGFETSWDAKWTAESTTFDDYYVVEIAIPFSSLKFEEGSTIWRFQTYRWDLQTNEQSAWASVPQNQLLSSLAFMGTLEFEEPLGASKPPIAVIPYINTLAQNNSATNTTKEEINFGGDVKIAIGTGLNLDLTVNPDFSTVEVDDIFTNLTRFELRLPERRQFFIDNNDLFGSFGNTFNEARPFFSRRIGLARDTTGNLIQNDIIGGARLSGKLNEEWRIGLLNLQTAEDRRNEIASNNNMMLAFQRKVLSRSNMGFFIVNRQTLDNYEFQTSADEYNRVVGADFNLASVDNKWTGKFYAHKSFQPNDSKGNYSAQATATYNSRNYTAVLDFVFVDQDFTADLGFVPRTDFFKNGILLGRSFYPSSGFVNIHSVDLLSVTFWQPTDNYKRIEQLLRFQYVAEFKNQSTFTAGARNEFIFLNKAFDPTRTSGAIPIPGNTDYNFNRVTLDYTSNRAKVLNFELSTQLGEFFNGYAYTYSIDAGFRFQPWVNLGMNVRYDQIRLPNPYPDADYLLLSPVVDVTFSKSVFWSTLIQYSNQRDNLGVNSRLQWRFAPLSDLFLVYNDNYIPDGLIPQFRSINLKLTYWLNPF